MENIYENMDIHMYEEPKSKVYVLVDSENRIIRCEGGYTMSNITNIEEWVYIDEGTGDRYNLAQSHYFEDGLYTYDGICRYKLVETTPELRSDVEIEVDRAARPEPEPQEDYATWDELAMAIGEGVDSV